MVHRTIQIWHMEATRDDPVMPQVVIYIFTPIYMQQMVVIAVAACMYQACYLLTGYVSAVLPACFLLDSLHAERKSC